MLLFYLARVVSTTHLEWSKQGASQSRVPHLYWGERIEGLKRVRSQPKGAPYRKGDPHPVRQGSQAKCPQLSSLIVGEENGNRKKE